MTRLALILALLAGPAGAEDPPGTTPLQLEVGKTAKVEAPPGSNILCDDIGVAAPEFSPDGNDYLIRGLKPGSTLCGVWLGNMKPGGLYRVTVRKAAPPPADAGT
jgi:hypothetical protein